MRYVFINPVTALMYEPEALNRQLERAGYRRIECRAVWKGIVKARYGKLIGELNCMIADARCPAAVDMLRALQPEGMCIAPLEPILLCCARELSTRDDLADGDKVITSPCSALADAGNALSLPRTRFATWREFARDANISIEPRALSECPVPPGFFDGLPCTVLSATGREQILRLVAQAPKHGAGIAELLYCRGGCHNGDGVWPEALIGQK